MENKQKLSIIILNYNAGKFLLECLESLVKSYQKDKKEKNSYQLAEVLVVDNGSLDNSLELIKGKKILKSGLKLRIIENKRNLGFSAGNNVGIKEALKANPDYVLFLNPDTVVFPGVLSGCVNHLDKNKKVGIVTPRLVMASGQLDEASHRGFPTPWRSFCHFIGIRGMFPSSKIFAGYTLGSLLKNKKAHSIDSCSGAFLLIRTSLGKKLEWWDEDYFWYGEDLDFCYRVKSNGFEVYFLPKLKITHYRGVSSGIKKHSEKLSTAKAETKLKAALASTQAMRIFFEKHYLNKYPRFLGILVGGAINFLESLRVMKIKWQSH